MAIYPTETVNVDIGGHSDTYEELTAIFPEPLRRQLYVIAGRLAVDADGVALPEDCLLVSGFSSGLTDAELEAVDADKLSRRSAVPDGGFRYDLIDETGLVGFDGDDSNAVNIIERQAQELRDQKLQVFQALEYGPIIGAAERQRLLDELQRLSSEISALRTAKASANDPIYYATRLVGLLEADPENNPLAYIGCDDPESRPALALYDRRSIEAAGHIIEEKSDAQFRIYGCGRDLMRHCMGVVAINYRD